MGMGADFGSLEVGKVADLVVLDADPLDDIRNSTAIHYVMQAGSLYEGDSLDMIWPRQEPLRAFKYTDFGPPAVGRWMR